MDLNFNISLNPKLFIKNPEETDIGKNIIKSSIDMINHIGYEQFTFKKLALEINTTEATVYRYFENKHLLLIYLVDMYWSALGLQLMVATGSAFFAKEKIEKIVDILVWEDNTGLNFSNYDWKSLYNIVVEEGSKTYLSKKVDELNKDQLYKPFKDLVKLIADVFKSYNPDYQHTVSLACSIIEISQSQLFFMNHLPRLSDFSSKKDPKALEMFILDIIFKTLG